MRVWLAIALVAPLVLTGCIRDVDGLEHNFVHIRGIDVAAPDVTSGSVLLVVNTTLDNREASSGEVRVVVKAFDTATGFLKLTEEALPGVLPQDKTVPVEVRLDVPRTSGYRIEVWVYEDGQVIETGQVTVHNLDALKPTRYETGLAIDGIDFLVRNVTNASVSIEAQVHLTNTGASVSRVLAMEVKARDLATRLIGDETRRGVPAIAPEATQEVPVQLVVPSRRNYEVEVILWDGNVTVGQGTGLVQLLPTIERPKDTELIVTEPRIEDFVRGGREGMAADQGDRFGDEASADTPGLGVAAALAVVALAAAAARRRWRT